MYSEYKAGTHNKKVLKMYLSMYVGTCKQFLTTVKMALKITSNVLEIIP